MDTITAILIIVFLLGLVIAYLLGHKAGTFRQNKHWEEILPDHRKDAILKSRAVLGGHFSEQLAPYLPDFDYLPTECRFIGKPIDFIVFRGMDDKNISEVIFVEVKSGDAKMNSQEKYLKEAIDNKRVKFVEYRIPKELTEKGNVEDKISHVINEGIKKKFNCEICGKEINHRGNCWGCNIKAKRERR